MKIETRKTINALLHTAQHINTMSSPIQRSGMKNENATAKKIFSAMKIIMPTLSVKQTHKAFSDACKFDMQGLYAANESNALVVKEYPVYLKNETRKARHDFVIMLPNGRKIAIETKSAETGAGIVESQAPDIYQRFMQSDCDAFIYAIGGNQSMYGKTLATRKLNAMKAVVTGKHKETLDSVYIATLDEIAAIIAVIATKK